MTRFAALLGLLLCPILQADELLPPGPYDQAITTPESYLGYPVGTWHVRHDQLAGYMRLLARESDRVTIEQIGQTHEQRPLLTLTITAPANHPRIDDLRAAHREQADSAPLVLWFGYSIHGNEASGSNAALLFAYYLAASEDPELGQALERTIILLDPSLNPDGLGRFAAWVNSHRSLKPVPDRVNREHQEAWPGGRFNHYWFDLNRDWLPLVHPESRARVALQRRWRPNVITDFHEMGSDQTYFFQPGVPSRTNPWTPARNAQLTAQLGRFHAEALDAIGQPYFTEETFDDFYYGKGSSYPDAMGSIGILFEQASARGHLMQTQNGDLSFRTAVRNQLTTSLSTLRGAIALRNALLDYPAQFDAETRRAADQDSVQAYVIGDADDPGRLAVLGQMLSAHDIEVFQLGRQLEQDGQAFRPGRAMVIPVDQPAYRLIKSLFDDRTQFEDNTFYDISSWHLGHAFDLPVASLRRIGDYRGNAWQPQAPESRSGNRTEIQAGNDAVAYALPWHQYDTARILTSLQRSEVTVAAATRPFAGATPDGQVRFDPGTLIVAAEHAGRLQSALAGSLVRAVPLLTGLTPTGPDLGSETVIPLKPVRPLILTGRGVNATEVGEVWHLLDQRLGLELVMVEERQLGNLKWSDYSHLLMVDGNYNRLESESADLIRRFVREGGVLVASRRAAEWATRNQLYRIPVEASPDQNQSAEEPAESRPYGEYERDRAETVVGGAVVSASVDTSHPMGWGIDGPTMALFRRGTVFLKPSTNPYETPLRYTSSPLLAGFLGNARNRQLADSAAVIANRYGRGTVIRLADNPNFRGFWYGTNRLYFNALFMAQTLESTPVADTETRL